MTDVTHPSPAERAVAGGYEAPEECAECTLAETDCGDHWQWRHIPLSRGYLTIEKEAVGQFVPELLAKLLREFMAWNHLPDDHRGGPDSNRLVCALVSIMTAFRATTPRFDFYFVADIESVEPEADLGGEA